MVQVPTSVLESWHANSQSGPQEAAHRADCAVSLRVRTLNLCGFPEESVTQLSELLVSSDTLCLQEVLINRLVDEDDTLEYELPEAFMILGGFKLAKLCGILLPRKYRAKM
eukprot:500001-Amphidinium_carterae.2